jgi:hypothetical protein
MYTTMFFQMTEFYQWGSGATEVGDNIGRLGIHDNFGHVITGQLLTKGTQKMVTIIMLYTFLHQVQHEI